MSSYAFMRDEYKDYVIAACIVHDTAKYGAKEYDKAEYKNHAPAAAVAFDTWCMSLDYDCSEFLLNAIASHMGQWSTDRDDRPFTNIDRCVHMADYMASRPFIDIPQIVEEYNAVIDNDLPF